MLDEVIQNLFHHMYVARFFFVMILSGFVKEIVDSRVDQKWKRKLG